MFGALDAFADPDYFQSHREGNLSLPNGQIPFRTAAFVLVPAGCEEIFEPEAEVDLKGFLERSADIYFPEDMSEHLAALTTCAEDDRYREVLILAIFDEI